MNRQTTAGHLAGLLTVLIWGTTFISTKVLLADFQPLEILLFRFVIGLLALLLIDRRRLGRLPLRQELTMAAAGLCGVCLYYLLENIALTYTLASHVGVTVSISPFFTAILSRIFLRQEGKLGVNFFAGFFLAMAGLVLTCLGGGPLTLDLRGELLAVGAAMSWGCYSVLTRKIGELGHPVIPATRRIFLYGILFMLPSLPFFHVRLGLSRLADIPCLLNILYLGVGASALCFVTWNFAIKVLGAIKTSLYIYLIPVVTTIASVLILKEPVTWRSAAGTAITIAGLFLSERRGGGSPSPNPD